MNQNTNPTNTLYAALLEAREEESDDDGWTDIILDNVERGDLSPHQFAGHLSALEAQGLYRPYDHNNLFGAVREVA